MTSASRCPAKRLAQREEEDLRPRRERQGLATKGKRQAPHDRVERDGSRLLREEDESCDGAREGVDYDLRLLCREDWIQRDREGISKRLIGSGKPLEPQRRMDRSKDW